VAFVKSLSTAATPADRSRNRSNRTFCIASMHDSICSSTRRRRDSRSLNAWRWRSSKLSWRSRSVPSS